MTALPPRRSRPYLSHWALPLAIAALAALGTIHR